MQHKKQVAATLLIVGMTTLFACNEPASPENKSATTQVTVASMHSSEEEMISRGRYLVNIMGCADCHTAKVMTPQGPRPDSARAFAGHPRDLALPAIDAGALRSWVLFNHAQTAYAGPWGVSYAANISSDESGIGNWTEEQFFNAMREGWYKGMPNGRRMLPPMPWEQYRQASDEDLRAIFRFLKSTPPVANVVPAPQRPKAPPAH